MYPSPVRTAFERKVTFTKEILLISWSINRNLSIFLTHNWFVIEKFYLMTFPWLFPTSKIDSPCELHVQHLQAVCVFEHQLRKKTDCVPLKRYFPVINHPKTSDIRVCVCVYFSVITLNKSINQIKSTLSRQFVFSIIFRSQNWNFLFLFIAIPLSNVCSVVNPHSMSKIMPLSIFHWQFTL